MLDVPPQDLAPRVASADVAAFPVPTGREEEWRFTPIREIAQFMEPNTDAGWLDVAADAIDAHVAVVDADAVDPGAWLPTDRPSAVARSSVQRVVAVTVADDETVAEPIVVRLTGTAALSYGQVDVRIGRDASATIVLVHDASVDASGSIVVDTGDGSRLTMLSIIDGDPEHLQLWQWHTDIGRDATFVGCVVTLGGRVVRVLPSVGYKGPGGSAELLGAFLADKGQFFEHRIFVHHDVPHCSSNVVYKGALTGDGAHTVWIGDVLVRRSAVDTATYEMNRNLLLDDGARADSVPNLELETGDVASAGHASATGRFDDEQLFYLQSRGIPEALARRLVVRGFFVDVLARIPSSHWRDEVLDRIETRLAGVVAAGESA